jgi:enoyl-[acyl-carrier-protein] reductase (NADH)
MLSSGITVAASRVVRPLQTLKGAVHSVAISPVGQILDSCSDVSREGDNI